MVSDDSCQTFYPICGPIGGNDTRFYVRDSFIYAGDKTGGLWLNTTGIGSNSTPQLSTTALKWPNTSGCAIGDSVITLTYFDSCNGRQARLVNASITGSLAFSLAASSDAPRTIHQDDSLVIHYAPSGPSPDTALLHLRLHLGFVDRDTTILLTGAGRIPKENLTMRSTFTNASVSAGQTTDLDITPDKAISGRGLSTISFDLLYNGDLLTATDAVTSVAGATIVTSPLAPLLGKERGIHVVVSGIDLSLDPAVAIARVSFKTSVTDTTSTAVVISNLKLNNGDQDFADCVLSADTSATTFTLALNCGDSTLIEFLKRKSITFSAIRPNPSRDAVQLEVHSPMMVDATFELVNALGLIVRRFEHTLTLGANTIAVDTKDLASGMYLVRLSAGGTVVSQSFVKE